MTSLVQALMTRALIHVVLGLVQTSNFTFIRFGTCKVRHMNQLGMALLYLGSTLPFYSCRI